jgi:hypothetical protein
VVAVTVDVALHPHSPTPWLILIFPIHKEFEDNYTHHLIFLTAGWSHIVIRLWQISLAVILASLTISLFCQAIYLTGSIWKTATTQSTEQAASIMSLFSLSKAPSRPPVYFLGIRTTKFVRNTACPAYAQLAAVGREITTKVKPKTVVVFSAHWQDGPSKISINVAEKSDLTYDFYGFPKYYYESDYASKASLEFAEKVIEKLNGAGAEVERVKWGLDYGVWVGFLAGMWWSYLVPPSKILGMMFNCWRFSYTYFDPKQNPFNAPILQASSFHTRTWININV